MLNDSDQGEINIVYTIINEQASINDFADIRLVDLKTNYVHIMRIF